MRKLRFLVGYGGFKLTRLLVFGKLMAFMLLTVLERLLFFTCANEVGAMA